ncbi:uncharacterized protein LOC107269034 isoform X5 [Cephus cinctus]|uniref:dTCF n=1 Tax=Cephus cinctus TaxID=211228 RepID=A0AAJ7FLM5_CEPCN|nr:uncharacterized protein LOC107269034 isoform X5 [Cephus cinctus]
MSLRGSKSVRSKVARKGRKVRTPQHSGAAAAAAGERSDRGDRGTGETTTGKAAPREGRCATRMREPLDTKTLENALVRWVERQRRNHLSTSHYQVPEVKTRRRKDCVLEYKADRVVRQDHEGKEVDEEDRDQDRNLKKIADEEVEVEEDSVVKKEEEKPLEELAEYLTSEGSSDTKRTKEEMSSAGMGTRDSEAGILGEGLSGELEDNGGTDGTGKWEQRYCTTRAQSNSVKSPSTGSSSEVNSVTSSSLTATTTTAPHAPIETLKSALEGYDYSRIYLAHVSFLDWRDLPGLRAKNGERVWVVGAADQEGRHRTRLLVAGRHWRPRCLSKVNMLSQPVVYAGGGRGSLTADLFLWWFHHEFAVTALAMHPDGAILVAESADYLPPENECVTADGLVRLFVIPSDCLEPELVKAELRVRLAGTILSGSCVYSARLANCRNSLARYLKKFTLKEAFVALHQAWLDIRSETFTRCWIILHNQDDTQHPPSGVTMSPRPHRASDHNADRMLLLELRNLAHDAGLDTRDSDLADWMLDDESKLAQRVKNEIAEAEKSEVSENEEDLDEDEDEGPNADEAAKLLSRVLLWMEREPFDPGLLLAARSMRDTAALMASKMGLAGTHPSGLPFFCPNGDHLTQPPPAHMGIPPYGALDAGKAAAAAGEYWPPHGPSPHPTHWKRLLAAAASTGLTRAPMYPFSTGQYPYPMLSPEMTQVAASWHTPSMYPISPASAGFRSPYPTSLPITSSSLPSDLYRFSPTGLMPPHPGLSPHAHALASHALVSSAPKADHSTLDHNHRSTIEQKNSTSLATDNTKTQDTGQQNNQDKKKPHIKKPLNAFMLYMKEMRAKVVAECTLKESAAINQILGRRWHALGREEQAKYYELARRERQLHMQLYPDWSSRANTNRTKKRKRKQDTNSDPGGNNMKKCRARYGLDQQSQWCKPCSPVEHGAGMGIHASIIHHGVGSSAGAGVGAGGGGGSVGATSAPPNTNTASNASSPQQEPTYVNL